MRSSTADDRERMIEFLRQYGDLNPDLLFRGTDRSGYKVPPGASQQSPVINDPLAMHELLDANLWQGMLVEEVIEWQPTMFQPVGGMDRIPFAFAARLDSVIRYGAVVSRIRQSDSGVTVTYSDGSGADQTLNADYCICAMPLTIARTLDADFSAPIRAILDSVRYDSAYKIAWEAPSGRRKRISLAASPTWESTWSGIPAKASSTPSRRAAQSPFGRSSPIEPRSQIYAFAACRPSSTLASMVSRPARTRFTFGSWISLAWNDGAPRSSDRLLRRRPHEPACGLAGGGGAFGLSRDQPAWRADGDGGLRDSGALRPLVERQRNLLRAHRLARHSTRTSSPLAATAAGTSAMAMLVLRNGAGEPEVTRADLFSIEIEHGVPVAGDAALDHLEADDFALRAAAACTASKASRPMKSPLSSLSQRSRPASKTLISSEISWP
jgi:hypothetical protein